MTKFVKRPTEHDGDPLAWLAAGAGMDLDTVRSLAKGGNLAPAVLRYQRRKDEEQRVAGGKSGRPELGTQLLTPRQRQVELLWRRAA
ncbi:hypothetical protein [Streptomyces sp. rh34]|uniref:hypothetical protein n=1 Tax=Streptomyces sp. rh34 TaxID=2034272 RepID=UPI000BF0E34F|nr:hypothetical protein [Streptomyces sp. rh34]